MAQGNSIDMPEIGKLMHRRLFGVLASIGIGQNIDVTA